MPFCFQHTRTNVRHATISNSNPNNLSCKFKWDKNRRNVFRSLSHLLLCFCTGLCVRGNTKLRKDARKRSENATIFSERKIEEHTGAAIRCCSPTASYPATRRKRKRSGKTTMRAEGATVLLNHLVEQLGCTWLRRPVALDNLAFLRGITARSSPAPSWVHLCRRLAIVCTALQV